MGCEGCAEKHISECTYAPTGPNMRCSSCAARAGERKPQRRVRGPRMTHLDLNVRRLALRAAQRLVDHDAAVGQRVPLALVTCKQWHHGEGYLCMLALSSVTPQEAPSWFI